MFVAQECFDCEVALHLSVRNRTVLSLSLAAASVMMGFGLFGPFLPLYAQLLGATVGLQVGLMTSAFMVTRIFSSIPSGSISDKIGRKRIIVLGLAVYSAGTLGYIQANNWTDLVMLRAVQGIGAGMFWPVSAALIADSVLPGGRGKALGFFNAATMTGIVGGPAVGGAIQAYTLNVLDFTLVDSFKTPFYFATVVGGLSALFAYLFVKEIPKTPKLTQTVRRGWKSTVDAKFVRTFYVLLMVNFAGGFAFSFSLPILVFFAQSEYNLSVAETAATMAFAFFVVGLTNMLIQMPSGNLADRVNRKRLIVLAVLGAQVFTFILPLAPSVAFLIVFMMARSALGALYMPSMESLEEDIMPRATRGKLSGFMDSASNGGAVAGPLVGFWFYDNVSHASPFFFGAAIFSVFIILFGLFAREPKRQEAEV